RHTSSYGDWSSDVCSSDLAHRGAQDGHLVVAGGALGLFLEHLDERVPPLRLAIQPAQLATWPPLVGCRLYDFAPGIDRFFDTLRSEERRVGKGRRRRVGMV